MVNERRFVAANRLFCALRSRRPLPAGHGVPYFHAMQISALARLQPTMAGRQDEEGPEGPGLGIATRTRTRTKKPAPYKVLMLNDDYTPMEFVVDCLQRFFRMDIEQATR